MTEVLEGYEIRVFREEDNGSLVDMQNHYPDDFGYLIPSVGDEIPCPMSWIGDVTHIGLNGFLVVKRRVFLYVEKKIVLVCRYQDATAHDYDIF